MDMQRLADTDIPLDVAKHVIATALQNFDPALGARAARILYDDARMNIVEEAAPKTGMMQCRPAGLTVADLQSMDMYVENYAERYGPHFTEPDNPRDYAVVDFEYTHTKDSLLYLAHEVGHALADDIQREIGRTFRDFSPDKLEEQGYFVQSIVAEPVSPDFNQQSASFRPVAISDGFNRESQRSGAHSAYERARTLTAGERSAFVLEVLGGAASERDEDVSAGLKRTHAATTRLVIDR